MNPRQTALSIIQSTLQAIDPQEAVKTHLRLSGRRLICGDASYNLDDFDRVRLIGFGKGSAPMAQAVHSLLKTQISDGLVIVKYDHTLPADVDINPIQIVEAGHPIPDENGLKHTRALIDFVSNSTERDLILCLISGGGSALLVQPAGEITLSQMRTLTQRLLEAGATITEINTIRKHLSAIKGGWLARQAAPATIISLILSDVGGDQLDMIASGPTVPDPTTFGDALALLEKYGLISVIDPAIVSHLRAGVQGQQPETPKPGDRAFNKTQTLIISNNRMAATAATTAAQQAGLNAAYFDRFIEGEARIVAVQVAKMAMLLSSSSDLIQRPAALIFGGETTVTMPPEHGLGGRNQELALACVPYLNGRPNVLIATLATDGNDGPTDAAGAYVDGQTMEKAESHNLDVQAYLDNHDSYHFFEALNDLIITGPTNTNVNDLLFIFAW
jgi:hydroxypyruvate reductase